MSSHAIQSYRLSIEWARIEESEGEFSNEAIDHYKKVLDCCHENNLQTCVTFQHFTSPLWFTAKGGWEKKENADLYVKYAEFVTKELGDRIDTVCTINEANLTACFAHTFPSYPEQGMKTIMPFVEDAAKSCGSTLDNFGPFLFGHPYKIRDCMMAAHVKAFPVIKGLLTKNKPVGIMKPNVNDENMLVMGYEYYPESLENVLRYVAPKINCPMIVTENGIGTDDDNQRIKYITTALKGLQSCLDDGLDIRGYYYWSFLDNFEWIYGYKPRFGLIEVNRDTLERKSKESLKFYEQVIRNSQS